MRKSKVEEGKRKQRRVIKESNKGVVLVAVWATRVSVSLGHNLLKVTEDPGGKSDGGEVHVRCDIVDKSRAVDEVVHRLGWD